jgi:polyisoprenoid-binding protein YceI
MALLSVMLLLFKGNQSSQALKFQCTDGKVMLKSIASLEVIQARSHKLRGVIDSENQSFAWTVEIRSFEGFNSPLQREHFNENYMESDKFTKASFTGKIIEKVDFSIPGAQSVRAKGKLTIHGIEQERIIKTQVENKGGKIMINCKFTVPVADHDIAIPKIVNQKIAEEIQVTIDADLTPQ